MAKRSSPSVILALDVGTARTGVAVASSIARLPRPLSVISTDDRILAIIDGLAHTESADLIVVGLPRNMKGLETEQSRTIREFAKKVQKFTKLEVVFAEESLSSQRAADGSHGYKSTTSGRYLDDVAACLILEEYFNQGAVSV